jgi:hypothetical protein
LNGTSISTSGNRGLRPKEGKIIRVLRKGVQNYKKSARKAKINNKIIVFLIKKVVFLLIISIIICNFAH